MLTKSEVKKLSRKELEELVRFYSGKCLLQTKVMEVLFNVETSAKETLRKGIDILNTEIYSK